MRLLKNVISKKILFTLPLLLFVTTIACGGRFPSNSRTTQMVRRHFNKYAKKYPTSPLGNKKVISVELLQTEEIHKKLIAVFAFVTMEGPEVYKVRVTLEKGPFGWRYIAWENLTEG